MTNVSRRTMLKFASATATTAALPRTFLGQRTGAKHEAVPQWECFETVFDGPSNGNPFVDVQFGAVFSIDRRELQVDGFYDGDGRYRIRFMPDTQGTWHYHTVSNSPALSDHTGTFEAVAPKPENHGPVGVCNTY